MKMLLLTLATVFLGNWYQHNKPIPTEERTPSKYILVMETKGSHIYIHQVPR